MITCKILTPNGPYKTLETESLLLGTIDGERGLLEHHMPITLILDISKIVTTEKGQRTVYAVSGGVCSFMDGVATICVNAIESLNEIDIDRAKKAEERAQKLLDSKDPNIDMKRAELSLKRALNRVRIASLR